ncbi:hypothetical protein K4P56_05420 [Staphylococcus epidermidis]|nr:hypothetical protein [Staphylococcus epidermidis]
MNETYIVKIGNYYYWNTSAGASLTKDVFRASRFKMLTLANECAEEYGGKVLKVTPKLEVVE